MKNEDVHMGNLVKSVFDESGMTVSELARQLYCERTNVYAIFRRRSIDTEMLARLSKILNHNFLDDAIRLYQLTPIQRPALNLQISLSGTSSDQLTRLYALLDEWNRECKNKPTKP